MSFLIASSNLIFIFSTLFIHASSQSLTSQHLISRFLDSNSLSETTNNEIEINIKADDADYYYSALPDKSIFSCKKVNAEPVANDICSLIPAQISFDKVTTIDNLSSPILLGVDKFFSFDQNAASVYSFKTDAGKPKAALEETLQVNDNKLEDLVNAVSFGDNSRLVIVAQGSEVLVYKVQVLGLEYYAKFLNPQTELIDFKDIKLDIFALRFLVILNKKTSMATLYTINGDFTLSLYSTRDNCYDISVGPRYLFIFTTGRIYAFDGDIELANDVDYSVTAMINPFSNGILISTEKATQTDHQAALIYMEVVGKKGFRQTKVADVSAAAKRMYMTPEYLYLIFENWVRIYPFVKEYQVNESFLFDSVLFKKVLGILMRDGQEFLTVQSSETSIDLLKIVRTPFGLECKKQKGKSIRSYMFQIQCYSARCDSTDAQKVQGFSNCQYTQNIKIIPEQDGNSMGLTLLIGLGFVAGIGLTMGFGVFRCFKTNVEDLTNSPDSTNEKKSFSINQSLRRVFHSPTSSITETRKFLQEGEESTPSEITRDGAGTKGQRRRSGVNTTYETPRFITNSGHNHGTNYTNVNVEEEDEEYIDTVKSSSDTERGKSLGKKKNNLEPINVNGPDTLDSGNALHRDLASFRNMELEDLGVGKSKFSASVGEKSSAIKKEGEKLSSAKLSSAKLGSAASKGKSDKYSELVEDDEEEIDDEEIVEDEVDVEEEEKVDEEEEVEVEEDVEDIEEEEDDEESPKDS